MRFEEIKIGKIYSFKRVVTKEDVLVFANLSGDLNKMHVDEEYGAKTIFKKNIVHGMLAGSLFSTLVGMYCPGENGLYLSQTLNFRLPIFCDDQLEIRGKVAAKNDSIKVITLETEIIKNGEVAINGEAKVKLLA